MKFRYQKIPFLGHDPSKPLIARPFIPVFLHRGKESMVVPYYGLLDSGADNILLPADLADAVSIKDISTGAVGFIRGVADQRAKIYFHNVEIEVVGDGRRLKVTVGFSEQISVPLFGRSLFEHYKSVIFEENKETVELKP